jgi:nucleotide-binding universal stress UspA family protein
MALCDILVCVDATTAGEARLKLAFNLAQAERAHVTGAYILPERGGAIPPAGVTPFILGPLTPLGSEAALARPGVATLPEQLVRRAAEQADIVEQRFREELRLRGLDGGWHLLGRGDAAELIELVHAADLTILGQLSDDGGLNDSVRPDDVLDVAGRPVLVVPYAGSYEKVGRRVLIAWDGTREASRALHDALPLIGAAEAVTVMHVGMDDADLARARPRLDRIVRHLGHHRIAAKAEETPRGRLPVAEVLLSRASDLAADMIVAGAYHHSRLRESLLGGVSRDLLDHMTVPVLMSH